MNSNKQGFIRKHGLGPALVHAWSMLARSVSTTFHSFFFRLRLRLLGCSYGSGTKADGRVFISCLRRGTIVIGRNFMINSAFRSNLVGITNNAVFQALDGGRILIGDNCGFTSTVISSRSEIRIGNHVTIGANVRIFDHDFHSLDPEDRRERAKDAAGCRTQPVRIGNDVFIGTNAMILRGVSIGDRSIIGAGAVVRIAEIPPDSIVTGNPATIVSKRRNSDL